jgi:hypothetical protein
MIDWLAYTFVQPSGTDIAGLLRYVRFVPHERK